MLPTVDAAMRLIAKASELYGGALSIGQAVGLRVDCEGCQLAGNIIRNQGLHKGRLVGQATAPGESLHADVAGPIVPMGIGQAKYVLVSVDELTRYAWVFPMRKKSKTARLLALLIQLINTQVLRPGEPGVRRLHSIKVVSLSRTRWRSSASGRASSTPSQTGHSTCPMD